MSGQPRYGIYFAPERASAFWRFGAAWLGRDAETGGAVTRPMLFGAGAVDWDNSALDVLTDAPRGYGFHGTLKPPFRLADGQSLEVLLASAEAFAGQRTTFTCTDVGVEALGRFIAFRLKSDAGAMQALAQETVAAFDAFRAPPTPEETAKRGAAGLSARQEWLLEKWGYPYVFDEFRFHMTLTSAIDDGPKRNRLAASLAAMAATEGASGEMKVAGVALYEQSAPGMPFRLLRRLPFGG
jgi:hypothetical protein